MTNPGKVKGTNSAARLSFFVPLWPLSRYTTHSQPLTLDILPQFGLLEFGTRRMAFAEASILDQTAEFAVDNMVAIGRRSL
jgi:hypothetical protein